MAHKINKKRQKIPAGVKIPAPADNFAQKTKNLFFYLDKPETFCYNTVRCDMLLWLSW